MTTQPGKELWRGLVLGAVMVVGTMPSGWSQGEVAVQSPEVESPLLKPSAAVQRVELKPVIKSEPEKVKLTPVLLGEPKAKATPKPEEAKPAPKPEAEAPKSEAETSKAEPVAQKVEPAAPKPEKAAVQAEKKVADKAPEKAVAPTPEKADEKVEEKVAPVKVHFSAADGKFAHKPAAEPAKNVESTPPAAEQRPTTSTAVVASVATQGAATPDMSRPEFELAQAVTLPGAATPTGPSSAEAAAKLDEAKRLLNAGDISAARRIALGVSDANPSSPEAPEARYIAATALQDLSQACQELHQLVLDFPRAPITRQALARLGEFSFILGKYDETVKAYTGYRMIETDAEALRGANLQLAIAALRGRKYDMAETEYGNLLRSYPDLNDSPDVLEGLAEAQLAVGRIPEAAQSFQTIDSRFPSYESAVKVTMGRGLCAELLGRTAEAIEFYSRILKDYPQSVEAGLAARRRDDLTRPLVAGA